MTKVELRDKLRKFFDSKNFLEESTEEDCKDGDYSVIFTTATERIAYHNFIDIEIWYLPTRNGKILVTGTELLMYEE